MPTVPPADAVIALIQNHPGLPNRLLAVEVDVAERVTEAYFERHPDQLSRFGERGRALTREDIGFHLANLAGAIAAWSPGAFEQYARWSARILQARNVPPSILAECLSLLDAALTAQMTEEEQQVVARLLALGSIACQQEQASSPARAVARNGHPDRDAFLDLLLQGRRSEALAIALQARAAGATLPDVYVSIVQEALYAVGRLWETNQITVGVEHMATAIAHYVVDRLYEEVSIASAVGRILVAGVQGERHQLGASMAANVLEADGWALRYLGTDLPHASVLHALGSFEPDILCISATMLAQVPSMRGLVRAVREQRADDRLRIVVCGGVVRQVPALARAVGADDAVGRLEEAPGVLRALVAGGGADASHH